LGSVKRSSLQTENKIFQSVTLYVYIYISIIFFICFDQFRAVIGFDAIWSLGKVNNNSLKNKKKQAAMPIKLYIYKYL